MPTLEVISGTVPVNFAALGIRNVETINISPLDVYFSQNVIYPKFSDGTSVDESLQEIQILECNCDDSEEDKEFDLILQPPFPRIEAVRWSPKLRDGEGKPLLDSKGEARLGAEALFSLDNRRLYVLQRAAVAQHPRRCRIQVDVLNDKAEVLRHLKKFRTRTHGFSISISEWNGVGRDNAKDHSTMRVWDWRSAVAAGGLSKAETREAAEVGSCGSWEYVDGKGVQQGPFSNWQMRQWWSRSMFPRNLRIRAYDPAASVKNDMSKGESSVEFRLVEEVFGKAPEPFAEGWSPRIAHEPENTWHECGECGRQRWEGWTARGQWYCVSCWRKWDTQKST